MESDKSAFKFRDVDECRKFTSLPPINFRSSKIKFQNLISQKSHCATAAYKYSFSSTFRFNLLEVLLNSIEIWVVFI